MAGEPARTKRGPRPTSAHPYHTDDLGRLVAAARGDARLARALAPLDGDSGVDGADWDAARRTAERAGVTLTQDRLRATWLHEVLQRPEPLVALVRRERLTRSGLENAMHHLPVPGPGQERDLLRG